MGSGCRPSHPDLFTNEYGKKTMIYTYESRVRYSEIDENAQMTLFSLFNNFQDCCTFHGEEVGVGLRHNTALGQGWVIANVQCRISRMPQFGERLRISTWAEGFRGMIAHRDFSMENTEGELLAEAATDWIFMDLKTRRPIRIPQEQVDAYELHADKKLTCDPGGRKVRMPEGGEKKKAFTIMEHHLDTNGHVNNAQYIRMTTPYLPADFSIHRLRVEYKKQAMLGDQVIPRVVTEEDGRTMYMELADRDGDAYFVAEYRS